MGVRRTWPAEPGIVLGYLAASVALFHRAPGTMTSRALGSVSSDSSLFSWWLGWTWYALTHLRDPLFSTWQNAPDGVNGTWNTSVPVLGALLGPVTATAGVVVTTNLAVMLGPAVSAYAAHRALAVLGARRVWRALGGLLYGFGPFVVAHAWVAHVNLVWSVFPPVVLWAVVRIVVRPRAPVRTGALLGVLVLVQFGLYTQTVALGAVVAAIATAVLAVLAPTAVSSRVRPVITALASAVVVVGVIGAWPLWLLLRGPVRPRGPIRDPAAVGADAANLVVPSPLTSLRPGTDALAVRLAAYPGEQGSYLGAAMLAVVLAAVVCVRSRTVVVTALVTVLVGVASLGPTLTVLGRPTGVSLPWRALLGVPLVGQAEAGRLAPFVALGVVAVWVLALEHLGTSHRAVRWLVVPLVLAAGATWLPADAQVTTDAATPALFRDGAPGLGAPDPDGGPPIVEIAPRPSEVWQGGGDALRWQAVAGFGFRQTGGYFIGGSAAQPVIYEGELGAFQRGVSDGGRGDPAAARADLLARRVQSIVIVPQQVRDPSAVVAWARTVAGDQGRWSGDCWVIPVRPTS